MVYGASIRWEKQERRAWNRCGLSQNRADRFKCKLCPVVISYIICLYPYNISIKISLF